jgi:hypothetical protein
VGLKESAIGRLDLGGTEPRLTTLLRLSAAPGVPRMPRVDRTGTPVQVETITIGVAPAA